MNTARRFWSSWVRPLGLTACLFCPQVMAGAFVAIVEQAPDGHPNLLPFDLLGAGHSLQLQANETLVLGYFNACRQETIRGGTVTLGTTQSQVVGGQLAAQQVPCSGLDYNLTQGDDGTAAGASIFRAVPGMAALPQQTVHSTQPLLITRSDAGLLVLEPDNLALPVVEIRAGVGQLDLRQHGIHLRPGESYFVTVGQRWATFTVAPDADPDSPSLLSRLLFM